MITGAECLASGRLQAVVRYAWELLQGSSKVGSSKCCFPEDPLQNDGRRIHKWLAKGSCGFTSGLKELPNAKDILKHTG